MSPVNNHLQNPAHGLDHHVVSGKARDGAFNQNPFQENIFLSTGFFTLCLFNLAGFLISLLGTLLKIYAVFYLSLAWLIVMAVFPVMWISRNKKMKKKFKTLLAIH